jgi:hypothetical protein
VLTQPTSLTLCVNSVATFAVVAGGSGPLTYQWRKNLTNIPGASSATLTLAAAQVADGGTYDVVVANACGLATSAGAVLTVTASTTLSTACVATASAPMRSLPVNLDSVAGQEVVVAANGGVQVLTNDGTGLLTAQSVVLTGAGASSLTSADFDNDGKVDVAVANSLAATVTVLFGNGVGGFARTESIATNGQPVAVAALGRDLVIATSSGLFLCERGSAGFGTPTSFASTVFVDVAIGDVLGSSAPEIVAVDAAASLAVVFDGSSLAFLNSYPCASLPVALALGDLTNDGKADIVVAGAGGVSVREMPAALHNLVSSASARSVATGNFNGDTKPDLAVVAASGALSILQGYNSGAQPDQVDASSCLLNGAHCARGQISTLGGVGSPCNSDELLLTRNVTAQVCALRFRCASFVQAVPGTGCLGYASLQASTQGLPYLGNSSFAFTLSGATPFSYAATLLQFNAPGAPPVASPFFVCAHIFDLPAGLVQVSTFSNALGQAINLLPIPADASYLGIELRSQWAVLDGQGPISGVALSNALLLRIGEY